MARTALQRMRQPVLATDHNGRWGAVPKMVPKPQKDERVSSINPLTLCFNW